MLKIIRVIIYLGDSMVIDYVRLRKDLIDYFGIAMSFHPMAIMNVSKIERATNEQLVEIALSNGFDLDDYLVKQK